RIKTAIGIISEASGVTRPVEVDIGGNKCILEFIVFDHDDHNVLLGIDWFHKTRAGIFPAHGLIKFPSCELSFDRDKLELSCDVFEVFTADIDEFEQKYDYFWQTPDFKMVPKSELNQSQQLIF
ncbi:hypothetical protein BpHYR1_052987, partial [Brachionus plicatilis]